MPVRDFQLLFEHLAVHRIDRARVVFEYQTVGNRRNQVDVDLLLAVRRDGQIVRRRHRRHFHELGYAAHNQRVRLDDCGAAIVNQVAEAVACVLVLARRYWDRCGAADEAMSLVVVRVHRLLEPEDIVLLRLARQLNRLIVAVRAVGIHQQLDIWADRLAHGSDSLHILVDRRAANLHLHGVGTHLHGRLHLGGELVQPLALFVVAARDIDGDAVCICAEQLVDGCVGRLALDVPEGDVYAADGAGRCAAPAHQLGLPHLGPQAFVVERVLPDDVLLHVVEGPHRHLVRDMLAAHVAVACDALVGLQFDEVERDRRVCVHPVANGNGAVPAVYLHRCVGDFHVLASSIVFSG